jgi:predicted RNase H-like HicB family nuclease
MEVNTMTMSDRQVTEEKKREYLRGLQEARRIHKESNFAFLEIVKDRLENVLRDVDTLEEAEEEIEKVIQLIDEYTEGEVPVKEIIDREHTEEIEETIKGLDTDEVISLTDFVRDDF